MTPNPLPSVPRPIDDAPPQVARFKVAHYVVNYLELVDVVVDVLYDLLAKRRQFTFTSGDRVRDAFGISECDIAARWADIAPTTLDAFTPETAHTFAHVPALWPALFDLLNATLGDVALARTFLRWIHNALCGACKQLCGGCGRCDPEEGEELDNRLDSLIFYQFQLNLLDQWLDMAHDGEFGVTFDQLLQLIQVVAAFRGMVTEVLDFSFEGLKFKQTISGSVKLKVDGVVNVTLPEAAADFFRWSLDGERFSLTLHFDEIAMADDSEFVITVDNAIDDLRFPFGGSINALRLLGVDAALVVDPQHGRKRAAPFAPYHEFSDVYYMERDGESLGQFDVSLDEARFSLASTVLTSLLSAGAAYLDLWQHNDIGDLDTALSDAAASAVRGLDDIGGLAGKLTAALSKVVPNALACATHDLHRPYLDDHLGLPFANIRAAAEPGALIIYNDGPAEPRPADDEPGPIRYPPTDVEILWPGILDELGPGPDNGSGGGRAARLLQSPRLDAVRIPAAQREEYARRLAAAGPLPPRQEAAARLLLDGLDLRGVRLLNRRQIDATAGTVAGVKVAPATLGALARLAPAGQLAGFPFSAGGRLASPAEAFAEAFTPFTPFTERLSPEPLPLSHPSRYTLESPLAARRGLAADPGWIGLSVNSYAVDEVLRAVAASALLAATGDATAGGGRGGREQRFQYATAPGEGTRLYADLTGEGGAGPAAKAVAVEVTLSRQGAEARYRVNGRMPLVPTHPASGCLPDAALLPVVTYAGCIGRLTGGTIDDADYRDELLYRHFIFLEPAGAGDLVTDFDLFSGDPDALSRDGFDPRPLLAAALRGMWANIGRFPVLFDPYYALSPLIDNWEARDGWLCVYERYAAL